MQSNSEPWIQKLSRNPAWSLIAAFGAYFCMYGFRRPYTAATYPNAAFFGVNYKVLLVISQTLGYVISKWLGIKIVSEIKQTQRVKMLLALIGFAELMLLCFGIFPRPVNIVFLFLNGLSLGMVFGLVLGFLEGRRNSEMLIAGLCASFILSDGVSKSAGKMLLDYGITENWMPFFAGLLFVIPSLIFIGMLSYVRSPSIADEAHRSVRVPMKAGQRWDFFKKYAPGLIGIVFIYLLVTLLRSIRADFAPELWRDLGYRQTPELFTQSELWVSFGVIIVNGLVIYIYNHYRAIQFSLLTCLGGFLILTFSFWGIQNNLGKFPFMVLVGLGVYIPYVAVHTTLFERLISITKERANIGFLMYLADSVGYTGYIILMLFRYAVPSGISILSVFLKACLYIGVSGGVLVIFCNIYFKMKLKKNAESTTRIPIGESSYF
jgi:hypothetical protein